MKYLPPMAQKIAGRSEIVEQFDKFGRRPLTGRGDGARNPARLRAGFDRLEEQRQARLALAPQHAIDGALGMGNDRGRGERRAMPADTDGNLGKARLRRLGEVDDLRHVCQIVAGEGDDLRPPVADQAEIGAMILDLQIDEPDRMAGPARRLGDEFEAERFEPQKYLGVEERAGMHAENPHRHPLRARRRR